MLHVNVRHMLSRQGKDVPDQFIITIEGEGVYFQSYNKIIAFMSYSDGGILLDEECWNYSKTTAQYRNNFLDEDTKTTRDKIKNGEYGLVNLN